MVLVPRTTRNSATPSGANGRCLYVAKVSLASVKPFPAEPKRDEGGDGIAGTLHEGVLIGT